MAPTPHADEAWTREAAVPSRHFGYRQKRSQETFHNLLRAAEELVAESSFDEASVAEISARAGVSVGAFYRRFENKEGLLHVVHERYTERLCTAIATMLDPQRWEGMSIHEILTAWTRQVDLTLAAQRQIISASARRAMDEPAFARREGRIHQEAYKGLVRLLSAHIDEIGHEQPYKAVSFVVSTQIASMHNRSLLAYIRCDELSAEEWSTELVRASLAYLQVKPVLETH